MDQYNLISSLVVSFGVQIVFFVLAATFRTDKVTDLSYGLTFIILAILNLFWGGVYSLPQILIAGLVLTWGLRLAGYLFMRILKMGKDKRFDGIRENFGEFAKFWAFQALAVWLIMLPTIVILNSGEVPTKTGFLIAGGLIWLLGISLETIADYQKFVFKNDPKNKGKWIESGVWKYSRHPNYFGEMLCWWGIFVIALPYLSGFKFLTVAGPAFITYILLFVSGIPPLEKKYDERYKDNKEYQSYKKRTSLLIPLPIKGKKSNS